MNGFTQLNDQIVTTSYLNCENNYSLNVSNLNSISECIERNERHEQQLAFDHWNKESIDKDYKDLHLEDCEDFSFNQFNDWNHFNINTNIDNNNTLNETLINDSLNINNDINGIHVNNNDNYLSFDFNNTIINDNNTNNSNKQIVRKLSNKLSTNKKLSRKESANSIRNPKPVSAYALFFRDAQSVIKSSNPSASFGEISKVVASNWEQLDKHNKNIYKQRADQEKKNYLKSLASSRAKQIAGLMDQSPKLELNALQENNNQLENNSNSASAGFSNDNNSEINTTTSYDSTQQQSDNSVGHEMRANQSFIDSNEQQLQQNLITTTENNNTAVAKQHCIRSGCGNDAIDSTEWDSEYCSSECCVKHCSDVFQAWVERQQLTANNG